MGHTMWDRKALYKKIWDEYTDEVGRVTMPQKKLAEEIGVPYQRLSIICKEWIEDGALNKFGHVFQLFDPETVTIKTERAAPKTSHI